MKVEDIKKLAEQYAEDIFGDEDYPFKEDDMCNAEGDFESVVTFLLKGYCIVPKSKIKEWKGIVDDALKADHVINEPAFRLMWERLFEEEKK
ncbi:MAG: hypothetical protein HDS14_02815 [Bacteroides sp.]|nr:hypothetical protein [Bacteroides sp.]